MTGPGVWHQLLHASVGGGEGRPGGWQVIDASPGLGEEQRTWLEGGVLTRVDAAMETDEFAGRETVEARIATITYQPSEFGGSWWSAVSAGRDATGRPGNVFTHAVLFDGGPGQLRPADLLLADGWLRPFGATELEVVCLGKVPTPPADVRALVLQRAVADRVRTEALLSAVSSCFEDDRPLVLVSESQNRVIDHLLGLSHLTAASVAARIPFQTFVRAQGTTLYGVPFHIVGMPADDLTQLLQSLRHDARDPLVLDLDHPPQEPDGDLWRHLGQQWSGGARWLDAFFAVADEPDAAPELLARMDDLFAELPDTELLNPDWPLALAALSMAGEAHPDRANLASDWERTAPWPGLPDPELRRLLQGDGREGAAALAEAARSLPVPEEYWSAMTVAADQAWQLYGEAEARGEVPPAVAGMAEMLLGALLADPAQEQHRAAVLAGLLGLPPVEHARSGDRARASALRARLETGWPRLTQWLDHWMVDAKRYKRAVR